MVAIETTFVTRAGFPYKYKKGEFLTCHYLSSNVFYPDDKENCESKLPCQVHIIVWNLEDTYEKI